MKKENNGGAEWGTLFEKVCHHLICHLPGHSAHNANTKTQANTRCKPAKEVNGGSSLSSLV